MLINSSSQVVKEILHWSYERVMPICIKLHFLPIKAILMYQICLLGYKTINAGEPKYLADILQQRNSPGNLQFRSSTRRRLVEPRISRTVSVNWSIEYSGPHMFNFLPEDVRDAFKKLLKIFLFCECYNIDTKTTNANYTV